MLEWLVIDASARRGSRVRLHARTVLPYPRAAAQRSTTEERQVATLRATCTLPVGRTHQVNATSAADEYAAASNRAQAVRRPPVPHHWRIPMAQDIQPSAA